MRVMNALLSDSSELIFPLITKVGENKLTRINNSRTRKPIKA